MLGRYRETVRHWSDPVGRVLFRLRLRPNHLTVIGLVVSFFAAGAFIAGHLRSAGTLLVLAGLCDLLDGSLARASGQVTAFGAFLDSVIDRYSDLVVLLGIVVLFARTPNARGALVAMAGLVGSVMVSYTKARAESIGIECNVGVMERPERMICLIAGALLDQLEPALWVLAILAMAIGVYFTLHRHVPIESTGAEFESPGWLTPLAVALGLGGILLAWLTYQRRAISADSLASMFGPIRYAALRGFWVDDVFVAGYRVGVLAFSRIVGWLDRYIVDGVVNVVSAWTVMAGERLRQIQTGRVQDYVFGVAVGVLLVLWWLGGTL